MLFSSQNVKRLTMHYSPIVALYHFPGNDHDHYASISDNSELKEWILNHNHTEGEFFKEISTCVMERPSDDLLAENKHRVIKCKKDSKNGEGIPITKCLCIQNFIINGYEDGLILVWVQEKNSLDKQESQIEEEEVQIINELNAKVPEKNYVNVFSLYFILLGHTQKILSLNYIEKSKFLITSSDSKIVKIYQMDTGCSIYQFNIDSIVAHTIYFEDQIKKNDPMKFVVFLCQEPYKLVINISKEPFSFNHYTFEMNNINKTVQLGNLFFLLGNKGAIFAFDEKFKFKFDVFDRDPVSFFDMQQWKKHYLIFAGDFFLRLSDFQPENKFIDTLFKISIGTDTINQSFCHMDYSNYIVMGSDDKGVYEINIEDEFNLYYNRSKMIEEEKTSTAFNVFLSSKKGKRRGKSSKKRGASAKRPTSVKKMKPKDKKPGVKSSEKVKKAEPKPKKEGKTKKTVEKKLKKIDTVKSNSERNLKVTSDVQKDSTSSLKAKESSSTIKSKMSQIEKKPGTAGSMKSASSKKNQSRSKSGGSRPQSGLSRPRSGESLGKDSSHLSEDVTPVGNSENYLPIIREEKVKTKGSEKQEGNKSVQPPKKGKKKKV